MIDNENTGASRQVEIVNELGLHARSAASIAKLAAHAKSNVWVTRGDDAADASSILDLLTLVCPKGTTITIHIDHHADEDVLARIVALVEDGFGE